MRQFKAISLFTGIGGLDLGFEAAGFQTRFAVDLDKTAVENARLNRPSWAYILADIHDLSSEIILQTAKLEVGEADILIGGPPCQPFSKSGYWSTGDTLRLDDPRADTLTAYLRILRDTQPKTFLLENVYGIMFKGKDEGLQHLINGIGEINKQTGSNYSISYRKINAADFGVPQLRERVFLIGSKDGREFQFPNPSFCDPKQLSMLEDLTPWRTSWDAIGDLPATPNEPDLEMGGKWAGLLPSIPEGQNYLWHTNKGGGLNLFGWRTRYWSFLLKLAKSSPSWTIQAQPGSAIGPFHWSNRKLSVRELCRLQTIPDDITFNCRRTEIQRLLGNAVPALLAEVLGREIRRQYLGSPILGQPKLLPPVRRDVPAPEIPAAVSAKYLHLQGNHAAHPGTARKKVRQI